ncbi:sigma-70 region 4 domain-containing protein [Dehalobacter sp. DCM]|uniref:sigma-70 region 4 domain-containing protein n=1 Tax=Dehalobacter sp. DCM TaxID=2907827 RepID=UPI0030815865|nr:sigma-70 region 4 domain-containing protein [Dehalobacter sp. DCM]
MHWEIRGLEKLSFRERQAVMLKESGRSSEDIAELLGISSSSVSTMLARAKSKGYQIIGIIQDHEFGLNFPLEDDKDYEKQ